MSPRQLAFDLPHRPALGREDFLVSPSNADAVAMLDGAVAWPNGKLALTGPEASGKTHLVHVWAGRTGAAVVAASDLAETDLPALAAGGAVAVEDVPLVAGRREAEAALFHLHNLLAAGDGALLVTGRGTPARWPVALADLASRLRGALVARIEPPDDALLTALLSKHFADRQMQVPDSVLAFVLPRMTRSAAAARALAEMLDRLSLSEQRRVGVKLARRALDALEDGQTS